MSLLQNLSTTEILIIVIIFLVILGRQRRVKLSRHLNHSQKKLKELEKKHSKDTEKKPDINSN